MGERETVDHRCEDFVAEAIVIRAKEPTDEGQKFLVCLICHKHMGESNGW